jgi:AP endonuclease-2
MGKRVFLTGDINIAKMAIDSAHALEGIRKRTATEEEYISAPSRKLFNSLLSDGVVVGKRDEGREHPVMYDICRSFHPTRSGMYTCWDTKLNTRPGNFGARIDYVLCSLEMKEWFSDSNIQEGLMVHVHFTGFYRLMRDLLTTSCLGIGPLPRFRCLQRHRAL